MDLYRKINENYTVCSNGDIITNNWRNTGRVAVLKPAKDKKGYLRVGLSIDGKLVTKKVHRLVASAFLANKSNKPQVNHKDGNKQNNCVHNLEWVTAKENVRHAIENGLFVFQDSEKSKNIRVKRGELNGQSKLTEKQVLEIRRKYKPRVYTRKKLAKEYKVKESTIKDVLSRKSWSHI